MLVIIMKIVTYGLISEALFVFTPSLSQLISFRNRSPSFFIVFKGPVSYQL